MLLQSQIEASEKEGGEGGEREANRVLTWSPWRPCGEARRHVGGGGHPRRRGARWNAAPPRGGGEEASGMDRSST